MNQNKYNETVNKFFQRNNINPEYIMSVLNCENISTRQINPIFEMYGMYKNEQIQSVSIANIHGFDFRSKEISPNIFESLNSFFDEYGDGYHSRSCSDLLKTADEMLQSYSFIKEPVVLNNLDPDSKVYIVSNNGLHRYTDLKVLYLNEIASNPEKREDIDKKFMINAKVKEIDLIKTYCNFIISKTTPNGYLKQEIDDNYNYTSNSIFEDEYEKRIFTDEELIDFVKPLFYNNLDLFKNFLKIEGFKKFVEESLYTMEEQHGL